MHAAAGSSLEVEYRQVLQEGANAVLLRKLAERSIKSKQAVGTQSCNQMRSQIRARRVGVGIRLANANNGLVL